MYFRQFYNSNYVYLANSKNILVKESELELKKIMRQQPIHKKNLIHMLLIL
ncbi:hypothetical protein LVDJXP189_770014 [Flavobacterium psychrophilum]|nr:hypothetical protein LVDJXP189_770014 [Flavobacterium psychrophilum]